MLISKFINSNVQEEIQNIERQYGIILPEQYKKFLNKYNGGYTPKTKFKIGKVSFDVRGFWGVGDVKLSIAKNEVEEWVKKDVFPIGCDSFGNNIVIGISNENAGKIYFSDHENENIMEYIAIDLKSFFESCKSEKISDASRRSIKEREDILIAKGRGNIITDDLRKMWQAEIDKFANMVQEEVIVE